MSDAAVLLYDRFVKLRERLKNQANDAKRRQRINQHYESQLRARGSERAFRSAVKMVEQALNGIAQ